MANINVKDTMILEGNIIPDSNNARSLGSGSVNWVSVHTNDLYVTNNVVTDMIPNVDGVRDLGSSSNKWKDAYVTDLFATGSSTLSGNVSVSGTISSDLLPDTSSPRDLGSASNRWKDAYVTDLYSSGSSTLGGNVSVPGTISSSLVPNGVQNIGSDGGRWNSLYGGYARITNNVHTGTGTTGAPAYAFESDTDTGMMLYNSGGIKAPAIIADGAIQKIFDSSRSITTYIGAPNLILNQVVFTGFGVSVPGTTGPAISTLGTLLAETTFTAMSDKVFIMAHGYTGRGTVISDTATYLSVGVYGNGVAAAAENTWDTIQSTDLGGNMTAVWSAPVQPGLTYTVRARGSAIDVPQVPAGTIGGWQQYLLSDTIYCQATLVIIT